MFRSGRKTRLVEDKFPFPVIAFFLCFGKLYKILREERRGCSICEAPSVSMEARKADLVCRCVWRMHGLAIEAQQEPWRGGGLVGCVHY